MHDNYNAGIWFDFDNAGALISDNYIANNWSNGIVVRGRLQRPHHGQHPGRQRLGFGPPWPAGVHGKDCYGGVPCAGG